jgi:GTP cyclohydrolase I
MKPQPLPSDPTRDATHGSAVVAVRDLLAFIGEDPTREGLLGTPDRVARAWREMTAGYEVDVAELLTRTFAADGYGGLVAITGVDFVSLCEHHLLPFTGTATVGYLPGARRVVGLSKLARLVDAFARRLQVQERMTEQIADAIEAHLTPDGVGVVLQATHSCLACRGARKAGAVMVTSSLRGALLTQPETRAEFMALTRP